jgi:hypothetical protein
MTIGWKNKRNRRMEEKGGKDKQVIREMKKETISLSSLTGHAVLIVI